MSKSKITRFPSAAFRAALDAVSALAPPGYATVPIEPTRRMLAAGVRQGRVRRGTAAAIWRAMVHESGESR